MSGKTSSAAKRRYNLKTYERIEISVKIGWKDRVKTAAGNAGESVTAYIQKAVEDRMEREA